MTASNTSRILYSCYAYKSRDGEQFIPDHAFSFLLSGSSDLFVSGKSHHFKQGEYRFFRRNQLARYTKYPPPGGAYGAISVCIGQDILHSISEEQDLHASKPYTGEGTLLLKPNPLFEHYISSLKPYLDDAHELHQSLTTLKVKEAVMLLLQTNPALKDILFDFSEPGKIDLEAYMNEHYKFTVGLDRFAYLTGRSLATFKRDFEKIFNSSPNRWLQQKRLDEAHYLLKEKGWKTSDVYMEVGFKDFSHFSFAFKKAYGIAPSRVSLA